MKDKTYRTYKQNLKGLTKNQKEQLAELCHYSNNLYNVALYNVRQHYFEHKEYLSFYSNCALCKENENYKMLQAQAAQSVVEKVDTGFKSFFALLKKKNGGAYDAKVRTPNYREKGSVFSYKCVRNSTVIKDGILTLPLSLGFKKMHKEREVLCFKAPEFITNDNFIDIEIIPYNDCKEFKACWRYTIEDIEKPELNKDYYLGIDLGVDNLATCVSNIIDPFIIDGKYIKSKNQWWNKEKARLQGIAMRQGKTTTNKIYNITERRNNQLKSYIDKASRYIINICLENGIGTLIIGENKEWKTNSKLSKKVNQKFVQIPYDKLKSNLEYLCDFYGIDYITQEESFTSKCSFIDNDDIPTYKKGEKIKLKASGKRITRGLYKTKNNIVINADVNGAYNIVRKCKSEFTHSKLIETRNTVSIDECNSYSGHCLCPKRINLS